MRCDHPRLRGYTIKSAAQQLRLPQYVVDSWVDDGTLVALRDTATGKIVIPARRIEVLVERLRADRKRRRVARSVHHLDEPGGAT